VKRLIVLVAVLALTASQAMAHSYAAKMEDPIPTDKWQVAPRFVDFSVDGDLSASRVQWKNWGQPRATAIALVDWRDWPSNRYTSGPGTLEVSGLVSCRGESYYTRAIAKAQGLPKEFRHTSRLATPCSDS
jgi:hypothetical protein